MTEEQARTLRERLEEIASVRRSTSGDNTVYIALATMDWVFKLLEGVELDFRVQRELHALRASLTAPAEGGVPHGPEQHASEFSLVDESLGGVGTIAFDVDMGARHVVSVSLTTNGLSYTSLLGTVSDHGYVQFDKPLPSILIDWLREQANKDPPRASRRTAGG